MTATDRPTPLTEALDIKLAEQTDTTSAVQFLAAYHELLDHARQLEQMCAELAEACRDIESAIDKALVRYGEMMKGVGK